MKVLFLKDVPRVARAGDIKNIRDGFGRNYLLPQGMAVVATRETITQAENLRKQANERRLAEAKDWQAVADALRETQVVLTARSGPTGRLYGSITNTMVAEQLAEMTGRAIDRRGIRFSEPVRQVGEYSVPVRLFENVEVDVKVVVQAEDADGA